MSISRRQFVRHGTAVTAAFVGLQRFLAAQGAGGGAGARAGGPGAARAGGAAVAEVQGYLNEVEGYGPLVPDPRQILDLPKGFRYKVIARTGDLMSDGHRVPAMPDGMMTFAGPNGRVILVRNHELDPTPPHEGPFGYEYETLPRVDRKLVYDYGFGRPHLGGTTTVIYNLATGAVERQFLSLAGTLRNCAGGETPWGSWITCEESVELPNETQNEQRHGYNFEVPASATGLVAPVPLKAMGRFVHEAVAVDPRTSIVYQTEDRSDGLIYRFIPTVPRNLAAGGKLQILALRDSKSAYDTRNYAETGAPKMPIGQDLAVRWIDIDNVDTERDDLRARGAALGAAVFARGEGMLYGRGEVYFSCTNGGLSLRGQIFKYTPSPAEGTAGEAVNPGKLQLYLEPNNSHLLESCDNVGIAPWGDIILSEDNAAPANVVVRSGAYNFIRGVTPQGKLYTLARNRYPGGSELAGSCFDPSGEVFFVNIQAAGLMLAITGPWKDRRA